MRWTAVVRHAVDKLADEAKERLVHLSHNLLTMIRRTAERCPHCGSSDVHRSSRTKPLDLLFFWVVNWSAHRCYACSHRFHAS
jgi:hypothetical protein